MDFNNVCRVCLGNFELQSIKENPLVIELLRALVGVDYETDNLPKQICLMCFGTFHEIYNFTVKCRETHLFLMENLTEQPPVDSIEDIEAQIEQENKRLIAELNLLTGRSSPTMHKYIGWTNPGETLKESSKSDNDFIETEESEESSSSSDLENDEEFLKISRKRGPYKKKPKAIIEIFQVKKTVHKCKVCINRYFPNVEALEKHNRNKHGERPFKCDQCAHTFLKRKALNIHMRTVHSDERPFKCDKCAMAFYNQSKLNRHLPVHDKHYKCDVCSLEFYSKVKLTKHKLTHKPFKCDQCEKHFITVRGLQTHKCKTNIISLDEISLSSDERLFI